MDKGALFEHVRKEFEDIGYSLQYKILNAVDYGVPQLRERVILVGFLGENPFQYPEPTHGEGLLPYVTLQDALKDLPALSCREESTVYAAPPDNEFLSWVRQGGSDTLTEHKVPNNSAHLRRIMAALKDGQGKDDLPEELRPKSGFKNTYAKTLVGETRHYYYTELCLPLLIEMHPSERFEGTHDTRRSTIAKFSGQLSVLRLGLLKTLRNRQRRPAAAFGGIG